MKKSEKNSENFGFVLYNFPLPPTPLYDLEFLPDYPFFQQSNTNLFRSSLTNRQSYKLFEEVYDQVDV